MLARLEALDSPDVQARAGSDLELAVVRAITAAYGGAVEAHSPGEGQGSRFEATLLAAVFDRTLHAAARHLSHRLTTDKIHRCVEENGSGSL